MVEGDRQSTTPRQRHLNEDKEAWGEDTQDVLNKNASARVKEERSKKAYEDGRRRSRGDWWKDEMDFKSFAVASATVKIRQSQGEATCSIVFTRRISSRCEKEKWQSSPS